MTKRQFSLLTLLATIPLVAAVAAPPPVTVSPGSARQLSAVDNACPTFSWGAVEKAQSYELIVYSLDEAGKPTAPALRQSLPGAATSWTPGLARCLDRGGRYAWVVRAIGAGSETDLGGWSEARLFTVPTDTDQSGLEAAVAALVERYLGSENQARGDGEQARTSATGEATSEASSAASQDVPASNALGGADFSIDGSGNVEGLSFAGDGSALTGIDWGNLDNIPVGFADGTDNEGVAYAAGNQLTLDATTFNVTEGSGSNLDADLLDGLDALAFALDAETYSMTEVDALLTVDNIDAPVPAAPTLLRVGPEYRFPGMRRLSWNMDSLAGVASFVVYQADFPITDVNKSSAQRKVTPSLHAAVALFPGSGVQHFRVEAQNVLGEAGPLSSELTIDTTSRLAYIADQRFAGIDELFAAPAVGGGSTVLNDAPLATMDVTELAWSPDGSRVAYRADQDTDSVFELYVAPASGGGSTKINDPLVAGGDVQSGFAWSPDGSRIAYAADQDTDNVFELYVAPASGGGATKVNDPLVTNGDVLSNFAWSPDGSSVAYNADQDTDGALELYVAPASGGGATKANDPLVTNGRVLDFSWSPNSSRIAYRADQNTDEVIELYVAPASGGGATKVNDLLVAGGDVFPGFAWSPDGSRIIYQADQDTDDVNELYVSPASGGGSTKINDPLVAGGDVQSGFAWSPDGSRIAYRADQDVDAYFELYVAPASGGGSIKVNDPLVTGGDVLDFAWSPDGSRIAYRADKDLDEFFELHVAPASGGGSTYVNDFLTSSRDVTNFAWSPDGSRLAYRADQDTDEVFELYVAPASGNPSGDISTQINDPLIAGGDVFTGFAWSPLGVE